MILLKFFHRNERRWRRKPSCASNRDAQYKTVNRDFRDRVGEPAVSVKDRRSYGKRLLMPSAARPVSLSRSLRDSVNA